MRNRSNLLTYVGVGLLAWLTATACTEDFGTPCGLPQSPEVLAACATTEDSQGNASEATCIDPLNADCETRLCVAYRGQDAVCSQWCDDSADCPEGGECVVPTGGERGVCLPPELIVD
ncbi:MAG: hypothetical protein KC561_03920 [Myxococcales bacterium]|nr:hypothetical protein [Myxococcales bacterium]